jgi:hypothetical protein
MRPSKAYIASFSTTGLLVALAVLLLIVVGALMAFREHATADRSPGPTDVTIGTETARVGTLSDRAAPRAAAPEPSTRGVVLTRADAPPIALEPPGAVLELPRGTPVPEAPPTAPQTASPPPEDGAREEDEEAAPGDGIEVDADLDGLMEAISPETGDPLAQLLEELGGAAPEEAPDAATAPHAPPAR